jgi:multidrug efflux pump subunit AcrA (membrane-fusion protein)
VFAPGHVEAAEQFTLTAQADGYIQSLPVQEGDTLQSGQLLLTQDAANAAVQQQTATASLQIAREQSADSAATIRQLTAQLQAAVVSRDNSKQQLDRLQRLYATKSVAKVDVDNAQVSYDNAVSNVASIQQNIQATRLSLQQSLISSRGQYQTAAVNKNYYRVTSPGVYRIYRLYKKKGEMLRKGEAIAVLGKPGNLKMILSIDEASIGKVQLQQRVVLSFNTAKDKVYEGYVSNIYPAFDEQSQSYTVEALLNKSTPQVLNGTLLQANIIVATKSKAMLIPRSCLLADGRVVKKMDKHTDTLTIQTGIIANQWVEVLSGLQTNDQILQP